MLKYMKTVVTALTITVAVVSSTQGESLLAEFGWNQPQLIAPPASYEFIVRQSLTTSPAASLVADVNAFGTTPVDAATVAQFNEMLAGSDGTNRVVYFSNGGQQPPRNNISFNAIWNSFPPSSPGFHYKAHVPRLGSALYGYRITRMEHAISAQGQTIYFYGTVIPEPAMCLRPFIPNLQNG